MARDGGSVGERRKEEGWLERERKSVSASKGCLRD